MRKALRKGTHLPSKGGTIDFLVRLENLGPALLKDQHPAITIIEGLSKHELAILVHGEVVVHNDFLIHSVIGELAHVDPIGVYL